MAFGETGPRSPGHQPEGFVKAAEALARRAGLPAGLGRGNPGLRAVDASGRPESPLRLALFPRPSRPTLRRPSVPTPRKALQSALAQVAPRAERDLDIQARCAAILEGPGAPMPRC